MTSLEPERLSAEQIADRMRDIRRARRHRALLRQEHAYVPFRERDDRIPELGELASANALGHHWVGHDQPTDPFGYASGIIDDGEP